MNEFDMIIQFVIAIALGGLIGIQVERNQNRIFTPGIRTHIIVATLGTLSYFMYSVLNLEYIVYAIFGSIILFIMHINETKHKTKPEFRNSLLYEILIIFSFMNGILIGHEQTYIAVFITLSISFLLYFTPNLHKFSNKISKEEIHSTLFFICISAILLPILPNKVYNISEIGNLNLVLPQIAIDALSSITALNPFKIWFLVVVISGISFCSYIGIKLLGKKTGLFLTSFLGGIVSSTALTSSFAISSQKAKGLSTVLASGIVLASCIMFVRVFIEILITSSQLAFKMALPLLITPIIGGILIYIISKSEHSKFNETLSLQSPFEIKPALYFTGLFVLVLVVSSLSLFFFQSKGLYVTAILSGLVDVDAITLSTSSIYAQGQIEELVAILTISLGVISNTIVKAGIAYTIGSKNLGRKVVKYFSILLITYCILLAMVLL